jgi:hypothetical protein
LREAESEARSAIGWACRSCSAKNNQERGGLSGIGGQMNETEDKPAAVVALPGKETEKPEAPCRGAKSFRAEADRVLQSDGKSIAEALATEAKKGYIQSAKFLYDLADENCKLGAMEMIRTARSLAMQWTTEPLWIGEVDEAMAETAGGSRRWRFTGLMETTAH